MKPLLEYVLENKRFVAAHRGSSGTAPENTIAAFREAIAAGAKMIETDIQVMDNGNIIAFHDDDFGRTVAAENASDIRNHKISSSDAGSWFSEKFAGEKIPSLEEVISFVKGKSYITLEIKSSSGSLDEYNLRRIIDIVKTHNYEKHTIFASFDHSLLKSVKQIDPSLLTMAIKIPGDERPPSKIILNTGSDGFICSLDELNQDISNDVYYTNIYLGVYGVVTEEDFKKAICYDVTALGTNYPKRIIGLLKNFETF